jgi:hypothetical protein
MGEWGSRQLWLFWISWLTVHDPLQTLGHGFRLPDTGHWQSSQFTF